MAIFEIKTIENGYKTIITKEQVKQILTKEIAADAEITADDLYKLLLEKRYVLLNNKDQLYFSKH